MNHFRCEKHNFYSRKPQPSCPYCLAEDAKKEAVKEILEMLEEFRTSYSIIGYEAESVGTIAKKLSDGIKRKFGLEI